MSQSLNVYCINCKEYILQTDIDTLGEPLVGSMFKQKPGMEWNIFHPTDTGMNLVCPLCSWGFHENGKIIVDGGEKGFIEGTPPEILTRLAEKSLADEAREKALEEFHKHFMQDEGDKPRTKPKKASGAPGKPRKRTSVDKGADALKKMGL